MPDYFTMDSVPGKAFFRCDRMRATISTEACSGMWRRADELDDGSHNTCRLCPVGAVHAGEVAASMSPLKGTLTCARCHRTAGRLIRAMVCVSCYNRQRERPQCEGHHAREAAGLGATSGALPTRLRGSINPPAAYRGHR